MIWAATLIKGVGAVASAVLSVVLLRLLGAEGLGQFYVLVGAATLGAVLASLGLADSVLPLVERADNTPALRKKWRGMVWTLTLIVAAGAGALTTLVVYLLAPLFGASEMALYALPLGALLSASCLQMVLVQICRTHEHGLWAAVLENGQGRNLLLLIGVFALKSESASLLSLFWALVAGSWALVALGAGAVHLRPYVPSRAEGRDCLRLSLGFYPAQVLTLGTPHLVLLIFGAMAGPVAVAVLGLAQRIAGAVGLFQQALRLALLPPIRAGLRGDGALAYRHMLRAMGLGGAGTLFLSGAAVLLGPPLLARFDAASAMPDLFPVTGVLLLGIILQATLGLSIVCLRGVGEVRAVHRSVMFGSAASLIALLPLVAVFGAFGAAATLVLGTLITSVLGYRALVVLWSGAPALCPAQ